MIVSWVSVEGGPIDCFTWKVGVPFSMVPVCGDLIVGVCGMPSFLYISPMVVAYRQVLVAIYPSLHFLYL